MVPSKKWMSQETGYCKKKRKVILKGNEDFCLLFQARFIPAYVSNNKHTGKSQDSNSSFTSKSVKYDENSYSVSRT